MTDCPYCANIPLAGVEGQQAATEFDQVLDRRPGVVLTPSLGMLVPGYLLLITTDHVSNLGCMGAAPLSTHVEPYLATLLPELVELFGPYLVFEHGSSRQRPPRQGGCVNHAHLHLIPSPPEALDVVLSALEWTEVPGISATASACDEGYVYAQYGDRAYLSLAPVLPGQWIRRTIAPFLGAAERWDWSLYRGERELEDTLQLLAATTSVTTER